ncbi:MAG: PQQ-dependent sugar dehydrogenase [Bacteroidetes bacterium]|nr:PQQ-dependent sugar dehydrogenase [Bacteroidota bacterium]
MRKILFLILSISLNCFAQNPDIQIQNAFPNINVDFPVVLTHAGDNTNRIFLASLYGKIYVFPNDSNVSVSQKKIFLDIVNLARYDGEMGLLGIAFHPNYTSNGYFYVNYNNVNDGRTTISRFSRSVGDPDKADSLSELKLLEIYQPYDNHKGGQMMFGADGYLYIGMGDGGNQGDPGNRAQNKDTLLGKILRIDINNTSGGNNYAIPSDNPFAISGGAKEVYAYGFRNPWRFSQDPVTGLIYVGDVGQNNYEEVDILQNGRNYGWHITEGFHCYNPSSGCDTSGITMPIKEYNHTGGNCSIISAGVYRGQRRPELTGAYIYGDYCSGKISMLRYTNGVVSQDSMLIDTPNLIISFGMDQNNEMYCLAQNGNIYLFNKSTLATNVNVSVIPDGLYDDVNNRLNIKDSVKIYLRDNASPYSIIDSASGILDSLTFTAPVIFNRALTGNYYIEVKHRNSLETWSSSQVNYTVAVNTNYNFTSSVTQAYGSNMILKNGKWCIYSGDINQDGFINGNDFTFYSAQFGSTGYLASDLNGDGIVNGNDFTIFSNNYTKGTVRP